MHRSQHCFFCILRENSNEFVSFAPSPIFEGTIVTKTRALVSKVSPESCAKQGRLWHSTVTANQSKNSAPLLVIPLRSKHLFLNIFKHSYVSKQLVAVYFICWTLQLCCCSVRCRNTFA